MNCLSLGRRVQVVAALVEGVSINATGRMTGVAKHTFLKLLRDLGCAAASHHDQHVRNLRVRRVQCDEIWAFLSGKDKNITMEQAQAGAGSVWTWTAIDTDTKTSFPTHSEIAEPGRRNSSFVMLLPVSRIEFSSLLMGIVCTPMQLKMPLVPRSTTPCW